MLFKDIYHYYIIKRSGLFDTGYYLISNSDVRRADIDPLWHFIRKGWKEGRNPSSYFETKYYLKTYNDIRKHNINPLIHFIKFGKMENRSISPTIQSYQDFTSHNNLLDLSCVSTIGNPNGKIAIHLHIYYSDLIYEFVSQLINVPFPYDLFISVSNEKSYALCKESFTGLSNLHNLFLEIVPNKGRDIAPFICNFGNKLRKYDFVGHFHTKKSEYNQGATKGWRDYLLNSLLGSRINIQRIFNLLQKANNIGIIYPQTFYRIPYKAHTWLANQSQGIYWGSRLGIKDIPRGYFDYPIGTMFWARVDALSPLFEAGITLDDFQEEAGQTDGTLSHCLERIIGLLVKNNSMVHGIIRDKSHPSWSTHRIDQYFHNSFEEFRNHLLSNKTKVIGFDLFDTLITRPLINPESIKKIVSTRIGGEIGQLYEKFRSKAETQAREIKGLDVCLDEIFEKLVELTGLDQDQLDSVKKLEEKLEIEIVKLREESVKLYKAAISSDKKVVIITDTFLPKETIETILTKFNLTGWDRLFVSNDIGVRKDNGELYKFILDLYSLQPDEMIMVGDNERSDNQIPENLGIRILHLLKPVEIARNLPRFSQIITETDLFGNLNEEITLGLVLLRNFSPISYHEFEPSSLIHTSPYNIGYSIVGPLLVSFSQWLIEQTQKDNIQNLFFLSREGKIIKQVFDEWSKGISDPPKSEYLELSRRATTIPSIKSLNDIYQICEVEYFPNSINKFLKTRFGLQFTEKDWEKIRERTNFSQNDSITIQNGNIDQIKPLLNHLEGEILFKSKIEREALLAYLRDKGIFSTDKKAIVDVGYGGTVQITLNKFDPTQSKTHGYYLMTDIRAAKNSKYFNINMRGCFGEEINPSQNQSILFKFAFELEKLLSSNEPQVEFYEILDNKTVLGHYRDLSDQEIKSSVIRNALNDGAMDYTRDACWVRDTIYPNFMPSVRIAKSLAEEFLRNTSETELTLLKKIVLDDYYCGRDLV